MWHSLEELSASSAIKYLSAALTMCSPVIKQKAFRYTGLAPARRVRGVDKTICTPEILAFKHIPENTVLIDAVPHEIFLLFFFFFLLFTLLPLLSLCSHLFCSLYFSVLPCPCLAGRQEQHL